MHAKLFENDHNFTLHSLMNNNDADMTVLMFRLISVFVVRICIKMVFS